MINSIQKSPQGMLPYFSEDSVSLKDSLRCAVVTKLCTDAYSPDVKLINQCIKEARCELPKPNYPKK